MNKIILEIRAGAGLPAIAKHLKFSTIIKS